MKKLMAFLAVLLAGTAAAATFVLTHPALQMEVMTDYVMGSLRDYHWSALKMSDPVTPALTEALGENHPESVQTLYNYLKSCAGELTWTVTDTDPEGMTSTVEVTYMDGASFLEGYADGLCDYIMDAIEGDEMELKDAPQVLKRIPDEKNTELLTAAGARAEAGTLTQTLTVRFQRRLGVFQPQGVSDGVYDAASAGLVTGLEGMTDKMAEKLVPRMISWVFGNIQHFDEERLAALTGSSMPELLGMEEDSPLYPLFLTYLRGCAGKMEYTVEDYDSARGVVRVNCSILDSQEVIQNYLRGAAEYIFTHLGNPALTDEVNARLLQEAMNASQEKRVEKTVTITFAPGDFGSFTVSEEIKDVVSANLYSEVGAMSESLASLKDRLNGGLMNAFFGF